MQVVGSPGRHHWNREKSHSDNAQCKKQPRSVAGQSLKTLSRNENIMGKCVNKRAVNIIGLDNHRSDLRGNCRARCELVLLAAGPPHFCSR
jgi:hypothetical protein